MNKIKWICFPIFLFLLLPTAVNAQQVCQQQDPCAGKSPQDKVSCYSTVVETCRNTRETLSTQINYMNNQIRLTTLKIESTKGNINKLSKEIEDFGTEISRLEQVLNQRSQLVLRRIPESYKRAVTSQFGLLLFSQNFSDFITRVKYLMAVQGQDAVLLFQVKATQNNYSERKQLREEKKKQFEQAKRELERQNLQLTQQKQEKDALLTATQGNEVRYSQLLNEARAQMAAFRSFVSSLGGASILNNQTYCNDWGCYFNQRDASWGSYSLGGSNLSMAEYGCLVSSVAMVASYYKKDLKPSDIASDPNAFFRPDPNTALLWRSFTTKGISVDRKWSSSSTANIDSELSAGRPVIVGLYRGPAHFVVLKSGSNGNYVMNDPFLENGHDVNFSSKYNVSDISEVDITRIN